MPLHSSSKRASTAAAAAAVCNHGARCVAFTVSHRVPYALLLLLLLVLSYSLAGCAACLVCILVANMYSRTPTTIVRRMLWRTLDRARMSGYCY
mmetsp:Transcript_55617/g.99042  ORF Transcript_55617/g.99042 Transcript_55617/m.99042 type:complete len:94 (-) Transcript_55617:119-400(-)